MTEMCMAYTLLVTFPSPETVLVSQTQEISSVRMACAPMKPGQGGQPLPDEGISGAHSEEQF